MGIFYLSFALQLLVIAYQFVKVRSLKRSISKTRDKCLAALKKNDKRLHEMYHSLEKWFGLRRLPSSLCQIPPADEAGIVLSVKRIKIPFVERAHNASLIEEEDGYLLIFRFNTWQEKGEDDSFVSEIGTIRLTRDFTIAEKAFCKVDTGSSRVEDPRIFQLGNDHYLLFNDQNTKGPRFLRLGAFDIRSRTFRHAASFEAYSKQMEKNWTPFSYLGELYFLYQICPAKVLNSALEEIALIPQSDEMLEWSRKWGVPRGGTPARLIDEEYLAFFHSSFEDEVGIKWYVMGAYTFASCPPFRIRRLSSYPILFQGAYDSEMQPVTGVRSLYPMGLALEYSEEGDRIHISCGENDSAVKIITLDKEKLFSSLKECGRVIPNVIQNLATQRD